MPQDFRNYQDPGIFIEETTPPIIATPGIGPTLIALLGKAGKQKDNEVALLAGTTAFSLRSLGIDVTTVALKSRDGNNTTYVASTPRGVNPFSTTLSNTINSSVLSLTVASVGVTPDGFPSTPFTITIDTEHLRVTNVTGSVLTVTRGYDSTTPASHNSGATVATTFTTGNYRIVQNGSGDTALTTVARESSQPSPTIADGTTVSVTYSFINPDFYATTYFTDQTSVSDKYGAAFADDGSVASELTLGSQLAFVNGATEVALVALQGTGNGGAVTNTDWANALDKLKAEPLINIVIPLSGDASSGGPHDLVEQHVNSEAVDGNLRRAFIGRDGVAGTVTPANFETQAAGIANARMSLVSPAKLEITTGLTSTPYVAPGYFAAAAVAGLHASLPPQEPLTRKQLSGFSNIPGQASGADILAEQAAGVLVLYLGRDGTIFVKHGLTTDMTSIYTREISIQSARDRLQDLIGDSVDNSALLGGGMTDETPNLVVAAVQGALDLASTSGLINDYSDVVFRQPVDTPTVIEVRFAYQPTLPLNYIQVLFALDTSTGNANFGAAA